MLEHKPLWTKKTYISPVSHLETNFTPLLEVLWPQRSTKFSHRINVIIFQNLIGQGFALVNIDDILLLAHAKIHRLDLIKQLHQRRSSNKHRSAPEKSFNMIPPHRQTPWT